jgi:hypothetical protein
MSSVASGAALLATSVLTLALWIASTSGGHVDAFAAGRSALRPRVVVAGTKAAQAGLPPKTAESRNDAGCISCHAGIEPMHPQADLSCVDCHGGNGAALSKEQAHVDPPTESGVDDERVAALDDHLAWRRFRNPMDLRVVDRTCGTCHEQEVATLRRSLHGTTAGHLSDGYYEVGLHERRGSRYAMFPTRAGEAGGELESLVQIPPFRGSNAERDLATHYADLARKECMQCHLWSSGRAVRGRVGFDGDYRGEGCAACHVPYAVDGLSRTGDEKVNKTEPGHAARHELSATPSTQTCTTCHYGDASIGLNYRGLSQLPPGAPGGPQVPGTTATELNRQFYLSDPAICPPDVHHERGMHCIDCHTQGDVMGDGKLHGWMEQQVEITCAACHGTFARRSDLTTERGTPLEHLRRDGERVVLIGKVDGKERIVPQLVDVLDRRKPEYNERAAEAMTREHERLECWSCHAAWNPNFLGFHFSRNASLSQLDLVAGQRTNGRVTTQEKVFATWKSLYLGLDEGGRFEPYLTGFSMMGSVWDESGALILDQVLPTTAAGLSGMTMIHHQMHTTRPTARQCVECHRSSSTWGLGSNNFHLARQLAFVADRRGVEVVSLDRSELTRSAPLGKVVLPDVVALAVHGDPLQGRAHHVYAAEGGRGIHVLDVADPTHPRRVAFAPTVNPKGLWLAGETLWVADGVGGIRAFDVSIPERIHRIGSAPSFDAHAIEVRWPWAYVADGTGGLALYDVRSSDHPRFLTALDVNGPAVQQTEAIAIATLFQYSRPRAKDDQPIDRRTQARNLCVVLDRSFGAILVDVTEPTLPEILYPQRAMLAATRPESGVAFRGCALASQVDPAEAQGGERTSERDYAYVLVELGPPNARESFALLLDVSDPLRMERPVRSKVNAGRSTEQLALADFYSAPFRKRILFTPGQDGVFLTDVSDSREATQVGTLPGILDAYAVALETFALDEMIDESGKPLKDVSHAGSRWLHRGEIERILDVSPAAIGTDVEYRGPDDPWGAQARAHLATLDADGSGVLEGDEYGSGGGASFDADGDRRVTLFELARGAGLLGLDPVDASVPRDPPLAAARVAPDGDLARLVDGVDPWAFDEGKDGRLDRREAGRAVFAALDLDDDGRLTASELSRLPGPTRQLRWDDDSARAQFADHPGVRSGAIDARHFAIPDAEWGALDPDHDGSIRLVAGPLSFQKALGFVDAGSEWPMRRTTIVALPPTLAPERLMACFDGDGDRRLTRREMGKRVDLFEAFDQDRSDVVENDEVDRLLGLVARLGLDALPDDFEPRWDLDGSGQVESDELPDGARTRVFVRRGR